MILSETQTMIQETARNFAIAELAPEAALRDQQEIYPLDLIKRMRDLGFLGMVVPEELGGSSADAVSLCVAIEEIGAADATCAVMLSAYNSLFVGNLVTFGSQFLQEKTCPV